MPSVRYGGVGLALVFAAGALGVGCGNSASGSSASPDAAAPGSSAGAGGGFAGGGGGGAGGSGGPGAGGAPGTVANAPCPQPSLAATWTAVPIAPARASIDVGSSWANGPNDVWLTASGIHTTGPASVAHDDQIQHWDGTSWTTSFDGFPDHLLLSVYGFGAADVWTVGDRALHWNGSSWVDMPPPFTPGTLNLQPVWGLSSNDVWTTGQGRFFHWNGIAWSEASVLPPVTTGGFDAGGIWGASSGDVWTLGGFPASHDFLGILHWNGATWVQVLGPTLTGYTSEQADVSGVWGAAASDIWAVGFSFSGSQIWHYDGSGWTHQPVPSFNGGLSAIWGFCSADIWAVGAELPPGGAGADQQVGIVLHYDGQAWSRVDLGMTVQPLYTVSGAGTDDLWVGGRSGTMVHRHR